MVAPARERITIIEPPRGLLRDNLRELWEYRELFGFMVWRDVLVRYKQTALGITWAILVPLATTLVFTFMFGSVAKLPSDGLPSAVFYMAGMVVWKYFSTAVTTCSNGLVQNQPLLTKIYIPRIIIPTTFILVGLVELLVAFVMLLLTMLYYNCWPAVTALYLPGLVLLAMGAALGSGLFFSALNVKYRDVRHVIPFLMQIWMYVTVVLPFSSLPERLGNWRYLYALNPMVGVVEGFRWCLLHPYMSTTRAVTEIVPTERLEEVLAAGGRLIGERVDGQTVWKTTTHLQSAAMEPWILVLIGTLVVAMMLLLGISYFKRVEGQFADVV